MRKCEEKRDIQRQVESETETVAETETERNRVTESPSVSEGRDNAIVRVKSIRTDGRTDG